MSVKPMTIDRIVLALEMDGYFIDRECAVELASRSACRLIDVDGQDKLQLNPEGFKILSRFTPNQAKPMTRDQIMLDSGMQDIGMPNEVIDGLAEARAASMIDGKMMLNAEGMAIMLCHANLPKDSPLLRQMAIELRETENAAMAQRARSRLESCGIVLPKV